MRFSWINWINMAAVVYLILINIIATRKEKPKGFHSKHLAVNIIEQIGRYGCIVFMILPIFTKSGKFGFNSVEEMLIWLCLTIIILVIYNILWIKKAHGGASVLYGLAVVPVVLFLLNGILLRHPALVVAALVFGVFHIIIVKDNIRQLNNF